jgi:hypothetical protein
MSINNLSVEEQDALVAEFKANKYSRDRQREYPSVVEQLDYIYHNGVDAWKTDVIDPIKAKYPKPVEADGGTE